MSLSNKYKFWSLLVILSIIIITSLMYLDTRKIYNQIPRLNEDIGYFHVELSIYLIDKKKLLPTSDYELQIVVNDLSHFLGNNLIIEQGVYLEKKSDSIFIYCRGNNLKKDKVNSKFLYQEFKNYPKILPKPFYNLSRWFGSDDFVIASYTNNYKGYLINN